MAFPLSIKPVNAQTNCTKHPPAVDVKPNNRDGKPGDQKEYTVKVTNKDVGAGCKKVKFTLTKEKLPSSKWTGSFTDNVLTIDNQKSKTTTLKIKSPTNASEGKKPITIGTKPANRAQKKTNFFYTVKKGPDTTGTPAPSSTPPPPTTCKRVDPEVTISQDKTYVKPGGGKITYTVQIKNIDQGPCPERNMNLTRTLHNDNWKAAWDPNNTFTFKKGETRNKKLAVTSPTGASKGTYKVKVNLRNNENKIVLSKEVGFVISDTAPTPTPTPTPTPSPDENNLTITVGADGIGVTKRIPLGGNLNPTPDNTNLNVRLYGTTGDELNLLVLDEETTFSYNEITKKLDGSVSIPTNLQEGRSYNLFLIGARYKYSQFPGSITLTAADKIVQNDNFNLITGDINKEGDSFNHIDLLDYNLLISCSIYSQDSEACDSKEEYRDIADLNFDGLVNEDDYTLFLKEVANQQGAIPPDQE